MGQAVEGAVPVVDLCFRCSSIVAGEAVDRDVPSGHGKVVVCSEVDIGIPLGVYTSFSIVQFV